MRVNTTGQAVGNVTAALAARQMAADTLIVFSADNGGVYHGGQKGNNYPLRGQKTSSWEGGALSQAATRDTSLCMLAGAGVPDSSPGPRREAEAIEAMMNETSPKAAAGAAAAEAAKLKLNKEINLAKIVPRVIKLEQLGQRCGANS